ncbi:MAG: sulfotransferase family protein [Steroidobacteraceae bacterium]
MQRTPYAGKIFAIGFYKTGTTTLFEALQGLGYRTINGDKPGSYPGADDGETLLRQIAAGDYRLPALDLFDAFTDNPYFHLWREMYQQFPDAKFILTVRDEQSWIASCARFYRNRRVRPMRVWMFGAHANPGADDASRQAWLDAYRAHNAAVREHFRSRPQQFLEFDPTQMREWGPLCDFLGQPVPSVPWPHANVTTADKPWRSAWRRVRRALGLEMKVPGSD